MGVQNEPWALRKVKILRPQFSARSDVPLYFILTSTHLSIVENNPGSL